MTAYSTAPLTARRVQSISRQIAAGACVSAPAIDPLAQLILRRYDDECRQAIAIDFFQSARALAGKSEGYAVRRAKFIFLRSESQMTRLSRKEIMESEMLSSGAADEEDLAGMDGFPSIGVGIEEKIVESQEAAAGAAGAAGAAALIDAALPRLSGRQRDYLRLMGRGLSRTEIAHKLGVSQAAVTNALSRIRVVFEEIQADA